MRLLRDAGAACGRLLPATRPTIRVVERVLNRGDESLRVAVDSNGNIVAEQFHGPYELVRIGPETGTGPVYWFKPVTV